MRNLIVRRAAVHPPETKHRSIRKGGIAKPRFESLLRAVKLPTAHAASRWIGNGGSGLVFTHCRE